MIFLGTISLLETFPEKVQINGTLPFHPGLVLDDHSVCASNIEFTTLLQSPYEFIFAVGGENGYLENFCSHYHMKDFPDFCHIPSSGIQLHQVHYSHVSHRCAFLKKVCREEGILEIQVSFHTYTLRPSPTLHILPFVD